MERKVLFERFNIDWLIRMANGGNIPFQNRTRKESLEILTSLKKRGYKTIRQSGEELVVE